MRSLLLMFILLSSCSTITQMKETLAHASDVIEENTQKMVESGLILEKNTQKIEKSGQVIAENTREIRTYTFVMQYAFPIFCFTLFLFNYMFFHKILKKINHQFH